MIHKLHLLGQVADGYLFRDADATTCGGLLSGEDLQHGRFAGTILADQSDAVFLVHYK